MRMVLSRWQMPHVDPVELVNEVYLELRQRLGRIRFLDDSEVLAYAYRVAVNRLKKWHKRERRRVSDCDMSSLPSKDCDDCRSEWDEEMQSLITDDKQREVVRLHLFENWKFEMIADRFKISKASVSNLYWAGLSQGLARYVGRHMPLHEFLELIDDHNHREIIRLKLTTRQTFNAIGKQIGISGKRAKELFRIGIRQAFQKKGQ